MRPGAQVFMIACMVAGLAPSAWTQPTRPALDPYSAPPLPVCDPMDWKEPADLPPLRERMTGEAYEKIYQRAMAASTALTPEQAKSRPLYGLRVKVVEPGSQADRLGITPGDLLVKLDEQVLASNSDLIDLRTRQDQELAVLTASGQTKTLTLKRGKIGVETLSHWEAFAAYLRAPGRLRQFDDDFRVAGAAYNAATAFTETALWHPWKAGYRGYPLTAMMAFNTYAECRYDDALAFASIAMKDSRGIDRDRLGGLAYASALASFKLEHAAELLKQYPSADGDPNAADRLDAAIKTYRSFPSQSLPNPIEQVRSIESRDMTGQITPVSVGSPDKQWMDAAAGDLAARRPMKFDAPKDHFGLLVFAPGAADVDLAMKFSFSPADRDKSAYARTFSVMVFASGREGKFVVKVTFYDHGKIELTRDGAPDFSVWLNPPGGVAKPGHLRIAVVGHRVEVVVDGRRLLYGPVMLDPGTRQLGTMFQFVGVKGAVQDLTWHFPRARPAPFVPAPSN